MDVADCTIGNRLVVEGQSGVDRVEIIHHRIGFPHDGDNKRIGIEEIGDIRIDDSIFLLNLCIVFHMLNGDLIIQLHILDDVCNEFVQSDTSDFEMVTINLGYDDVFRIHIESSDGSTNRIRDFLVVIHIRRQREVMISQTHILVSFFTIPEDCTRLQNQTIRSLIVIVEVRVSRMLHSHRYRSLTRSSNRDDIDIILIAISDTIVSSNTIEEDFYEVCGRYSTKEESIFILSHTGDSIIKVRKIQSTFLNLSNDIFIR